MVKDFLMFDHQLQKILSFFLLDKKDKNGNSGKPKTLKKSPFMDLII